jgi:hypothetical protein
MGDIVMSHTGKGSFQQEPMMSPMELTDLGSNMTALIHGVVQTNLRTMLEFSRAEDPQAFADLQRRFAREYLAALQHGIMTLVSALRPDLGSPRAATLAAGDARSPCSAQKQPA